MTQTFYIVKQDVPDGHRGEWRGMFNSMGEAFKYAEDRGWKESIVYECLWDPRFYQWRGKTKKHLKTPRAKDDLVPTKMEAAAAVEKAEYRA